MDFRTYHRVVFVVDAVVYVLARSDANRHRRTGGHRPVKRVSVSIFQVA